MRALKISTVAAVALLFLGLTPQERELVVHAKQKLRESQVKLSDSSATISAAESKAYVAERYSAITEEKLDKVEKDVKASHDNEERLAKDNAKMRPVYDKVTSWFGIGAILFGFGLLVKNLLILVAFLLVVAIALFLISMAFPWIGEILKLVGAFISRIIAAIRERVQKK